MLDATLVVGNAAIVCTLASNFAGLPTCLGVVRKKSTAGVSCLPFFTATVNASMWLLYGLLIGDRVVMAVNAIALFLQCFYLGCFFYATSTKLKFAHRLLTIASCVILVYVTSFNNLGKPNVIRTVGLFSCTGSIATCASPLAGLKDVLRTRSTQHLPFLMIATAFATTTLWLVYGTLIGDLFIQAPNLIAALLSGFQLTLFAVFDSKPKEE